MRLGRVITAGTMAMSAYGAYKRFKGQDQTSHKRGRSPLGGGARTRQKHKGGGGLFARH